MDPPPQGRIQGGQEGQSPLPIQVKGGGRTPLELRAFTLLQSETEE